MPALAMTDLPPETNEALREALLALRQEHDALRHAHSHTGQLLDALESLLTVAAGDDAIASVFVSLRKTLLFSYVCMLAEPEDGRTGELECIVSENQALVGSRWPVGSLFRKVMNGRAVATLPGSGPQNGLPEDCSALYAPVRVRDRRGVLLLVRDADMPGFDRADVALAQRFSVLASHALATRYAHIDAAESKRLRELGEQLRLSEKVAQRNAGLLHGIVDAMPVGVIVRRDDGDIHIANGAARTAFGRDLERFPALDPSDLEAEASPVHGLRRRLEASLHGPAECPVRIAGRERTMLVSTTPVRIFDQRFFVTSSLDITDRKAFEEQLRHRAFHDQLTGLPNRTAMDLAIGRAISSHRERGDMFALAFIDLDNFKQVNDYYSHALGDRLLLAVAERIRSALRPQDMVGRISGDEFLLLIDGVASGDEIETIIAGIAGSLRQPFQLEGRELLTSASIGVSMFPLHGEDAETLRRAADNAMYRAKNEHKGSATWFNESMSGALTARMDVEQRLRGAIRDGRLRTAYQPKVRLDDARVVGFEALVRWIDADGSVRLPGEFIAIANELNLIDDITFFVLGDIIDDLPTLRARHGRDVTVSHNVSARQAGDLDFMRKLTRRIEEAGVAHRLMLELTEEALLAAASFQNEVLPLLRALGLRVSIDDFGSGYSSFAMLADITTDELKIDRAFIAGIHEKPRSQGVLKAIESVCKALNIAMVAEGVELQEEVEYLRAHTSIGCAQGFFFGRPEFLSVDEAPAGIARLA